MRKTLIAAGLSAAILGATASSAGAAATVTPASYDFGSVSVGGRSAPKAFTVGIGDQPVFLPAIAISGPFTQTNDCGLPLLPLLQPACTVNVTFSPSGPGLATGSLVTGTNGSTAALRGTGAEAAPPGKKAQQKCKKKKKKGKKGATAAKKKKKKCGKKKKQTKK